MIGAHLEMDFESGVLGILLPERLCSPAAEGLAAELEIEMAAVDCRASPDAFVLDFSFTRAIDSTGLNLVFALVREARRRGIEVRGRGSAPVVQRALGSVMLDRWVRWA